MPDSQQAMSTTIISVILGSVQCAQTVRKKYVERFVHQYREPLVQAIHRRYRNLSFAEDCVHEFFLRKLIEVEPSENIAYSFLARREVDDSISFRSYLRRSLYNFVADQMRATQRSELIERSHVREELAEIDRFDADWASNILSQAISSTCEESIARGQEKSWKMFEFRFLLPSNDEPGRQNCYDALIAQFNIDSPKTASNRIRTIIRRFERKLRSLIADYLPVVSDESQRTAVDSELRELKDVLVRMAGARTLDVSNVENQESLDHGVFSSAELLSLPDSTRCVWGEAEFSQVWRHILDSPTSKVLRDWGIVRDSSTEVDVPFGQLIHGGSPSVFILQSLKDRAKQANTESSLGIPREMCLVIYLLAIGLSFGNHGQQISSDSVDRFHKRIEKTIGWNWIDNQTRQLFARWISSEGATISPS